MKRRNNGATIITFILCVVCMCSCEKKSDTRLAYDPPDENRFTKVNLVSGLDEPMELTVLPNGDVLFIERKGAIKLFSLADKRAVEIGRLNVFSGLEDGLLGLAIDPDFVKNSFIYLYYSPAGEKSVQRVSRFVLADSKFNSSSERILLEIPTQRIECCHSAGSLAFGPDKTLYIAVGDNTNPHNPGYYNSIDERKGREYWDAQRTAANTNDLRGKILRIKPEPDGSYSIPEGNLFPKGTKNARGEIYAMGCRNPYRISVDQETGFLYWGDVGQNTEDNPARGPISYDEFHQAKRAGFFGWPYFAGPNEAYADFDFTTGKIGPFFDPQHPKNDSPNNTGLEPLPPAQGALIWYSYDSSKVFDHLGTGGKSPIGGPVYRRELNKKVSWITAPREFPPYYDGKLFIAEWMRDWINVVTLDDQGKLRKIERFMPNEKFDHPIDLEFGPDGALYILEYGTFWFAQNKNARLARIDFAEGNRKPVARALADKVAGAIPLTVHFSADSSFDYDDGDTLAFTWSIDEKNKTLKGSRVQHTFNTPGEYKVTMRATDRQGAESTHDLIIRAGNEPAVIELKTSANKSFYWPGRAIQYAIDVTDKEDGSVGEGTISPQDVEVVLYYTQHTRLSGGGKDQGGFMGGLELINQSDCKSCHHADTISIGPSYKRIAQRYKSTSAVIDSLAVKIIKGGSGNWGETAMSAHPQLQPEEAVAMVNYILSLAKETRQDVGLKGVIQSARYASGDYILETSYRDRGATGIGPLVAKKSFRFRNPVLKAVTCDQYENVSLFENTVAKFAASGAYIMFSELDLSGIKKMRINCSSPIPATVEIRIDSAEGQLIGKADIAANATASTDTSPKSSGSDAAAIPVNSTPGLHDVYIIYKDRDKNEASIWNSFDLFYVKFESAN